MKNEKEFIIAFAKTIGESVIRACEYWSTFSSMLTNDERKRIINGGQESGMQSGKEFNELYPKEGK